MEGPREEIREASDPAPQNPQIAAGRAPGFGCTDEELMKCVASGGAGAEKALDQLSWRYADEVKNYVRTRVSTDDNAAAVCRGVWNAVQHNKLLNGIDWNKSFHEWLEELCRHVLLSFLAKHHADAIQKIVNGRIRNHEDARDVNQDLWEQAIISIDDFEGASDVKNWLNKVAVNKTRDHVRHLKTNKRKHEQRLGESASQVVDPGVGPSEQAEEKESKIRMLDALRECISRLDEQDRLLLECKYYQGLTAGATGKRINCGTKDAVSSRLGRIRKKLGKCVRKLLGNA